MKKWFSFSLKTTLLAVLILSGFVLYLSMRSLPVSKVEQGPQMYDLNGDLLDAGWNGKITEPVALKDISPYLVHAVLAIEDKRFYKHVGLDFRGIARATAVNIEHMSKVQGAGTITQQLARNMYLSHERTWTRKLKEMAYALQLEMKLSKDSILEKYLNQIYYGHSTYGIEAAAQLFFGKSAGDLTLAESALLAGVPKGPRYYSPYYDEDRALERQKLVLSAMKDAKYITQEEAAQAAHEKLAFRPLEERKPASASYFRDYVRMLAIDRLGLSEEEFDQSSLRVHTTLDLRAQRLAESIVASKMAGTAGELQVALVAIDPRNGYIRSMVGGKDYHSNQFNRAVSGKRQPGSAFKPFVYLTALENGYTPLVKYKSEPTAFTYDEGRLMYMPSNFNNRYENKEIDMREAIAKSDNIYAVQTIQAVGPDRVIDTAQRFGLRGSMKPVPSLALGTLTVSPLQLAAAYDAIAGQGMRAEPMAIVRIQNGAGDVLYEAEPRVEQVAQPAAAYVLTHLMESVFEQGGTGARVSALIKRPIAGKSGSTDTDSWMVGFTPDLTTAVWVGYDKGRAINAAESHISAPIFAEFIEGALSAAPPKPFTPPDGVVTVSIDPASGTLANDDCRADARLESFIAGTEPAMYCTERGAAGSGSDPVKSGRSRSWWGRLRRLWSRD